MTEIATQAEPETLAAHARRCAIRKAVIDALTAVDKQDRAALVERLNDGGVKTLEITGPGKQPIATATARRPAETPGAATVADRDAFNAWVREHFASQITTVVTAHVRPGFSHDAIIDRIRQVVEKEFGENAGYVRVDESLPASLTDGILRSCEEGPDGAATHPAALIAAGGDVDKAGVPGAAWKPGTGPGPANQVAFKFTDGAKTGLVDQLLGNVESVLAAAQATTPPPLGQ